MQVKWKKSCPGGKKKIICVAFWKDAKLPWKWAKSRKINYLLTYSWSPREKLRVLLDVKNGTWAIRRSQHLRGKWRSMLKPTSTAVHVESRPWNLLPRWLQSWYGITAWVLLCTGCCVRTYVMYLEIRYTEQWQLYGFACAWRVC